MMFADSSRKWCWTCILLLIILIGASACGKPRGKHRPCYPYFVYLFPEPEIFGEDTVMTSPDWDVSVEYTVAQPNAVCNARYTFRGSVSIDFYVYDTIVDAMTGYQNLIYYTTSYNSEYVERLQTPEIAGTAPHADELSIGCVDYTSGNTQGCTVAARYGTRVYLASLGSFDEYWILDKYVPIMIEALDAKLMIDL